MTKNHTQTLFSFSETTAIIEDTIEGINLEKEQINKIYTFYEYLYQKNQLFNLTGVKDPELIFYKNILDVLFILKLKDSFAGTAVDIGSGAGIPSILMAILFPEIRIDSVETKEKKINFQFEIKEKLKLNNFFPLHCQANECQKNDYDYFMCRAFKDIKTILIYSQKLNKKQSDIFLWKGQNWLNEWNNTPKKIQNSFELIANYRYEFHNKFYGGNLLHFKKIA